MQRIWALDKFSYSIRIFIALTGSVALCWYKNEMIALIQLFLGIIASALAETDDNWQGRLHALVATIVCFSIAALLVELLFPYPWVLASALALASFCLTMLGALGERYSAIASATLILSVYTMTGIDQRSDTATNCWHEPLLLIAGAAWYGVLSVLWQAIFPNQPIQQIMARLYRELGYYLKLKSSLFEPMSQLDVEARCLKLAKQNSRVVTTLNAAKEIILHRIGHGHPSLTVSRYLKLYFLSQDIHEHAISSYYPYNALATAVFYRDALFHCQCLLHQQSKSCQTLAHSIQLQQPFIYNDEFTKCIDDLNASLKHFCIQNNQTQHNLSLYFLSNIADNLAALNYLLSNANNLDSVTDATDNHLLNKTTRNFKEMYKCLRTQFTLASLLFRHALRLALALTIGYCTLHIIHAAHGYWIILTTLFVCQPNYGATKRKLGQRIIGTIIGLTVAWALFSLFPNQLVQSMFAIAAGLVFFINRTTSYTLATTAITLMVLFCCNQVDNGYGLFLPRLFDTMLGSLIAGLAVFLFLPDWQGRRLNTVLANTLACNSNYLRQIMQQYAIKKRDDHAYRLARLDAYNADATLSITLTNMLMEPKYFRKEANMGFHFLVLSHTLLGYLSGLGAYRKAQLQTDMHKYLIDSVGNTLAASLDKIATGLANNQPIVIQSDTEEIITENLEQMTNEIDKVQQLVQAQLALICRQLKPLRTLAMHLNKDIQAT